MEGVFETKLNSADRKELEDSDFGLPEERKFPLNDEEHVRKAIQFFKFCPVDKRMILAKNINKRVKELNMSVTVGEDNPYYKYSNRLTTKVTESALPELPSLHTDDLKVIRQFPIFESKDLNRLENLCLTLLNEYFDEVTAHGRKEGDTFIVDMNIEVGMKYEEYLDYISFYTKSDVLSGYKLCDSIIEDIKRAMDNGEGISKYLHMLENCPNLYHAYRCLCDLQCSYNPDCEGDSQTINYYLQIVNTHDRIYQNIKRSTYIQTMHTVDLRKREYEGLSAYGEFLNKVHNEIKNDLYIINKESPYQLTNHINTYGGIYSNILSYAINPESITGESKTTKLSVIDIFKISSQYPYVIQGRDINNEPIYYVKIDDCMYVILKSTVDDNFYIYTLYEDSEFMSSLITDIDMSGCGAVEILPLKDKAAESECVDEGLSSVKINKDGDIKIEISPNKNYMDSYSENHKLLDSNWKNKNYDAMKKNLAFAFAMISIIERSDDYKEREPEIVKARAFYTNDFKTYLKHLQSVQPDFDFARYYINSDFDKKVINVPKNTIVGVKNLIKALIV